MTLHDVHGTACYRRLLARFVRPRPALILAAALLGYAVERWLLAHILGQVSKSLRIWPFDAPPLQVDSRHMILPHVRFMAMPLLRADRGRQ